MTKAILIDRLRQDIINRDVCPELRAGATQLVMGDGDLDAKILFIGEAPGKKEDELGRPFVGASGKLLDQLLFSINLSRQAVYITNLVKYRPPSNRDPSLVEKAEFSPYLIRQIEIIQPELIVTLGKHSLSHFKPKAIISEIHGQLLEVEVADQKFDLLALYHPAAALYNGKMRQTLFDDFKAIKDFLFTNRKPIRDNRSNIK